MRKILLTSLLTAAFLAGCSQPEPLHDAMESMGSNFKALRDAQSIDEKKQILAQFKEQVEIAKQQKVRPEDQKTFDEGMEKLSTQLALVMAQVEAGQIENLQAQLKKLGELRKEYHELLEVK
ncbi:cytochrome b562 [Catenovulum sp. 2E275]|uniref:cytochrome b562 n=1 Tax=Catenovulum sp. 2E275 TaxID=2980497 RepID=UPI0021CF18B8|nr:cytochrome b562 [Catenovulum sp. 2E275]MCU4677267.1 cytochrome b562 [Catenovulum sp. 2E275]